MEVDLRTIAGHVARLTWVALRSFLGTLLVLSLIGAVLAGLSAYFLRNDEWYYATVAAVLALVEAVGLGFVFGTKRAMAMAMAHGLGVLRLGRSLVRLVFERMLKIDEGAESGERGSRIVQSVERLPLGKADELLSRAVRGLTGDIERSRWFRRTIHAMLLELVRKYTLARFREEGAKHGGVDLLKVKDELEETIDEMLVQKIRSGLRLWNALAIIGLPLLVALQTYVLVWWLHSR